jgi:hypothetical protein
MAEEDRGSWRWKVENPAANRDLNLLYEPGSWGDALKGAWAVITARAVIETRSLEVLRYLDPFAGAPVYPLVDAARRRLEKLPLAWLAKAQEPYATKGTLASTALLVRDAAEAAGAAAELEVFDADATRLAAWREVPRSTSLRVASGDDAFAASPDRDLVLVDPYDLLDRCSTLLPLALAAAARSAVLLYLYNRAPRGGGHERAYGTLRKLLDRRDARATRILIGRVPSDARLPRAYHEMILAGPEAIVAPARPALEDATRTLSRHVADAGAFEDLR